MNEFSNAAITIVTIIGTVFASMMIIKASLKESIDHITKAVDRLEVDQKETNARLDQFSSRLDQLYQMFIDLLKEGKK